MRWILQNFPTADFNQIWSRHVNPCFLKKYCKSKIFRLRIICPKKTQNWRGQRAAYSVIQALFELMSSRWHVTLRFWDIRGQMAFWSPKFRPLAPCDDGLTFGAPWRRHHQKGKDMCTCNRNTDLPSCKISRRSVAPLSPDEEINS